MRGEHAVRSGQTGQTDVKSYEDMQSRCSVRGNLDYVVHDRVPVFRDGPQMVNVWWAVQGEDSGTFINLGLAVTSSFISLAGLICVQLNQSGGGDLNAATLVRSTYCTVVSLPRSEYNFRIYNLIMKYFMGYFRFALDRQCQCNLTLPILRTI